MAERHVLVIGGGIGGITAGLELASCGVEVTMLEEGPSIGGRMIQLDKTFPTLDCSSCTLTPRMVEVALNSKIELLTLSTPIEVSKIQRGFQVKIRKRPRYVNPSRCTACGLCSDACVMKGRIKHEFDCNLGKRAAIYIPFPQAVPQKYLIDDKGCLFVSRGRCKKACVDACGPDAIDFSEKEEIIERYFNAIIVAPGFDLYDPTEKKELGYGTLDGVISGIEFERLCSVTGPTAGEIRLDGRVPKRFYFIQCVGSRDRQTNARFCSRVCCMYTAKHANIVRDRIKDAQIYISHIDVRAYGKGYEEFYRNTQDAGVFYIRGIPGEIVKTDDGLLVRVEDMLSGEIREIETDIVILATGIRPHRGTEELCRIMSLERDEYGFVMINAVEPSRTNIDGIFVCGMASGPKDIADTVASAGEAAARCMEYVKTVDSI